MEFDISNITLPAASLLGATWLFSKNNQLGWAILAIGMVWWGIDQAIQKSKFDKRMEKTNPY